jgi:hypothetical protein
VPLRWRGGAREASQRPEVVAQPRLGGGGLEVGDDRFLGRAGPKVPLGWTAAAKNKGEMGGLPRSDWAEMHLGC